MQNSIAEPGSCAETHPDGHADHPALSTDEQVREKKAQRLRMVPREAGVALMGFGIVGVLLLDPADIVFVLAGALVFAPRLFHKTELCYQQRFPDAHRATRRHLDRFIDDFERRFPEDFERQ